MGGGRNASYPKMLSKQISAITPVSDPPKKYKEEWLDRDLKVILVAFCTLTFV